jgi:hypothetical protein
MNPADKITQDLLCLHRNGLINLNLDKPGTESQGEFYYAHLSLAVIDAVFSKGEPYSTTAEVVNNYCNFYNLKRNRHSDMFPEVNDQELISGFLKKFYYEGEQSFRTEIFKNSEPATEEPISKSKAMAVYDFAWILHQYRIECFQDIEKVLYDNDFAESVMKSTGLTDNGLNYFFMLAGSTSVSRPVRLTIDFFNGSSDKNVDHEYSVELVNEVCGRLKSEFSRINPRILGFLIWEYMRNTRTEMPN